MCTIRALPEGEQVVAVAMEQELYQLRPTRGHQVQRLALNANRSRDSHASIAVAFRSGPTPTIGSRSSRNTTKPEQSIVLR